jgi:myo-inositol-1(or 4)-monophosphatase
MAASLTDAEVAVRAAAAGAAVARAGFGSDTRRVSDAGLDFTTEADIATERAIRAVLSDLRPADAIVGEELGADGSSSRRWLVDPICGTLNFAARVPLFAVNVALDIDGVTTAAAVVDPIADDAFWTDGANAWQRVDAAVAGAEVDRPLAPTTSSRLLSMNLDCDYPGSIGTRLLSDESLRSRFSPRCMSTTLALAWVATGQQAAYVTAGDLRGSVHWAAGVALCRAAGAVISNLAGGDLHSGGQGMIAAADAEAHDFLLARLDSLR